MMDQAGQGSIWPIEEQPFSDSFTTIPLLENPQLPEDEEYESCSFQPIDLDSQQWQPVPSSRTQYNGRSIHYNSPELLQGAGTNYFAISSDDSNAEAFQYMNNSHSLVPPRIDELLQPEKSGDYLSPARRRRRVQNRIAQRTYRERKDHLIQTLKTQVTALEEELSSEKTKVTTLEKEKEDANTTTAKLESEVGQMKNELTILRAIVYGSSNDGDGSGNALEPD